MACTPEKRVKTAIKSWLDHQKHYHLSPIGGAYSTHGVPDIVVCANGRFVGIECKAPGKADKTTYNQKDHIARINDASGLSFVATCVEDVVAAFRKHGIIIS